jgi:hypothetical protein
LGGKRDLVSGIGWEGRVLSSVLTGSVVRLSIYLALAGEHVEDSRPREDIQGREVGRKWRSLAREAG